MTEPLQDTWFSRDLPILRSIINGLDTVGDPVRAERIVVDTGLPQDAVDRGASALVSARLIEATMAGKELLWATAVSGESRRLAGSWPSPDSIADRLLATLEDLAEHGGDEVTRSKARKALAGLGSLGRDTLVAVAGAAAGVAMQ